MTNCKFEFSQSDSVIKGRVTIPNPGDVRSDVSDVRNDVRPRVAVLGWRRIGHGARSATTEYRAVLGPGEYINSHNPRCKLVKVTRYPNRDPSARIETGEKSGP